MKIPQNDSATPSPSRFSAEHSTRVMDALEPFKPAVVYLFGSFGTDSQHPDSDIDIAFLPTVSADPVECFQIANLLAEQLLHHVDLVDLTQASAVLSKEVLRAGIAIHTANPGLKQQFEMLALSNYARLNEERQAILAS